MQPPLMNTSTLRLFARAAQSIMNTFVTPSGETGLILCQRLVAWIYAIATRESHLA